MSPSVFITTRIRQKGKTYVVRYRLGGRDHPLKHAGSFKTLTLAKARRDFIAGELAAGRDPRAALAALANPTIPATLYERFGDYATGRVDVGEKSQGRFRFTRARLGDLGVLDPQDVTVPHVQAWVAANRDLAPDSLRQYLGAVQQVLDVYGPEPNPARSRQVRLPKRVREEPVPPAGGEWQAIVAQVIDRHQLVLRLIEAEGLRITEALSLTYGDIDFANGRLRVSSARTKAGTAGRRWLAVPAALLMEIDALVPLEDRHRDRKVFPGRSGHAVRAELTRACKLAGVAHYHPHDLRHRRVSLWIAHGIDIVTVRTWAGHSKASMSSDTYGHVVIDARADEWRTFWLDTYRRERLPDVQRERSEA